MKPASSSNFAIRIPPLAVCVGFGLVAWIFARAMPALTITYSGRIWLAAACALAGVVFSLLGVHAFRQARTTVNPLRPDAATALVVSGVYRITRNPMYVGFLFFLLAEIAWLANPVALVAAPLFVVYLNRFQIRLEEAALSRQFGAQFDVYASRVRRWL